MGRIYPTHRAGSEQNSVVFGHYQLCLYVYENLNKRPRGQVSDHHRPELILVGFGGTPHFIPVLVQYVGGTAVGFEEFVRQLKQLLV